MRYRLEHPFVAYPTSLLSKQLHAARKAVNAPSMKFSTAPQLILNPNAKQVVQIFVQRKKNGRVVFAASGAALATPKPLLPKKAPAPEEEVSICFGLNAVGLAADESTC